MIEIDMCNHKRSQHFKLFAMCAIKYHNLFFSFYTLKFTIGIMQLVHYCSNL